MNVNGRKWRDGGAEVLSLHRHLGLFCLPHNLERVYLAYLTNTTMYFHLLV